MSARLEELWAVQASLDDCSPQVFGFLCERLLEAGARDVTLTPVLMKKGRPGVVLEALVDDASLSGVEDLILVETPTLGVRRHRVVRRVLERAVRSVRTRFGPVRVKSALDPRGRRKSAPEYEDCRRAARKSGVPLREVMEEAMRRAR